MFRKIAVSTFCLMFCALSFARVRSTISSPHRYGTIQLQQLEDSQTKDLIRFKRLFGQLYIIEQRARQQELSGRDGTRLRLRLPHALGLSVQETLILHTIAFEIFEKVAALDFKANEIIRKARIEQSQHLMQGADLIPTVPPELSIFQAQKDNSFMHAKDELQQAFGSTRYELFVANLDESIAQTNPKTRIRINGK